MNAPHIPGWQSMDSRERASAVIDWCQANDIETASINARGLSAAMDAWEQSLTTEMPQVGYDVSPMDYVHHIRGIATFLAKR